ncbi:MAG: MarR family winged helix-turn-helix transcriptional regulator [Solobacterium sp.]|jgi:DNA-binding MarR family transcriptional regulator|nr:MarR family winged helix-turn-helix transcriptional regulator [Solobacterium sp.]MCH4266150.1 MarR family winged helix-turn-helix transcriptional regulator [Solobacterium sp.]
MTCTLAYDVMLMRKDYARYCNERLEQIGISSGLLIFVQYIGDHPDCAPKTLAGDLRMDFGYVTRNLRQLETARFIRQSINPKDHRAHTLKLSEKGKKAYALSNQLAESWEKEALSSFTRQEQKIMAQLMKKVLQTESTAE